MSSAPTFDPVWTALQANGQHLSRWPWDSVVTFVFRNAPRERAREDVRILEVGCGGGPNLWFAAREGFSVTGIDGSEPGVEAARARFAADGLDADLRVGDFTALPFADATFDLAIDRGSITCCGFSAGAQAVAEVRRVLRPGGRFLFVPYASEHASASAGVAGPDGLRLGIDRGPGVGVGQLCFYDAHRIEELFAEGWRMLSRQRVLVEDADDPQATFAEWRVVCERL